MTGMINSVAAKGRNGDTRIAHVTPGEVVVPKEIAAMRPDIVAYIADAVKAAGGDPGKLTVGRGRVNPKTGIEEFATQEEIVAAYQRDLNRTPNAEEIGYWANPGNNFAGGSFAQGVAAEKAATASPAASSPAPASGGGAPAAAPPPPDIMNWYRNAAGRDATDQEIGFHQANVGKLGAEGAYGEFTKGLKHHGEKYTGMAYADASKAYGGYQSTHGKSTVDDWARNLYNRAATAEEIAQYGTGNDAATAQANFERFTAANGGNTKNMTLVQASQLVAPKPNNPASGNLTYTPNLNREINAGTETIEGRIGNLMATDAQGNYTNQVIRQAHDRAMQGFAKRGLLNSSMAQQAGQEAVIAKAIEIAGPDAQRYFEQGRANQDSQNTFARDEIGNQYDTEQKDADRAFTLRQDYQKAQQSITANYQRQLDTINASNMTPEDKSTAIAQATAMRDGELVFNNNMYSRMPSWKNEWLAVGSVSDTQTIAAATNVSYLENIINDPAQTQAMRDAARARLQVLRAAPAPTPSPSPSPAPAGGGMIEVAGGN